MNQIQELDGKDVQYTMVEAIQKLSPLKREIYNEAVERGFIENDGYTFNLKNITTEKYYAMNLYLSKEQPCELLVGADYLEEQLCVTVTVKTRENETYMAGALKDSSNFYEKNIYYFEKTDKGIGKDGLPEEVEVIVNVDDHSVTCKFSLEEISTGYRYECIKTWEGDKLSGSHVSSSGGTHSGGGGSF